MPADGWRLRPGLAGARAGRWRLVAAVPGPVGRAGLDGRCLAVEAGDDEAGLNLLTVLRLHPSGVLEAGHTLRNLGMRPTWSSGWPPPCRCRPGRSSCST